MTAANAVYEIVVDETNGAKSWLHAAISSLTRRDISSNAVIVSVRHKETGDELFRHIEEAGDDEDHLLAGIEQDLASMTAQEFVARWGS